MSYEHQIGFLMLVISTVHLAFFWVLNWKAIHAGFTGEDKIWQAVEVLSYVAIVVWTSMLFSDSFFGFRASDNAWNSINIVIGVSILGLVGKSINQKWVDHLNSKRIPDKEP